METAGQKLDCLLRPRSIAVVGASATPGSAGANVLRNLEAFAYPGEVYLINPHRQEIDGRSCLASMDDLPEGVDAALLCVPQAAVPEAVAACARRGVKAAVVFAAGFAEKGPEGSLMQAQLVELAVAHGMLLAGPNCMGLTNFVDGVPLTFSPGLKNTPVGDGPALAVLTQSGGLMSMARECSQARGIPLTYAISTGNEAMVGLEDYLEVLVADPKTSVIALYAEQLRQPQRFLKLARQARQLGKPLLLLHPGQSGAAREAVQSHTGKLAGDHAVMRTLVEHAGVLWFDSLEAWLDAAWLLTCQPPAPGMGIGVVTDSGALKTLAFDWAERDGVWLPAPSAATAAALTSVLPSYTTVSNPLDITAQALSEMDLYPAAASAMLADPAVGSLLVAVLPASPEVGLAKVRALLPALTAASKPVAVVVMGDEVPVADELVTELRAARVPLFRSPERALRALDQAARWAQRSVSPHSGKPSSAGTAISEAGGGATAIAAEGARVDGAGGESPAAETEASVSVHPAAADETPGAVSKGWFDRRRLPCLPERTGVLLETEGKRLLAALGLPVPPGMLVRSAAEAVAAAEQIGYPVVLKVQAPAIAHKSDIGGVFVGLRSAQDIYRAWEHLADNVARAYPGLAWEALVEAQAPPGGVELVVGARRDPQWGPVTLVGLGGVGVEVWKDVVLLPPDASSAEVQAGLQRLRGAAWLQGTRGRPPVDLPAVVRAVQQVGAWLLAEPRIAEVDVNPLVAYPAGQGVLALDVLIVLQPEHAVAGA